MEPQANLRLAVSQSNQNFFANGFLCRICASFPILKMQKAQNSPKWLYGPFLVSRLISNLTATQLVVTMVFPFQWCHAFHEVFRWHLNSIRSLQTSSANWLLQSLISNSSRSYAPSWWRCETKWLQWPWSGDIVISYVRHAIRLENQRSAQILKIEIFSRKRLPHSKGAAPKQNRKIIWNGWWK